MLIAKPYPLLLGQLVEQIAPHLSEIAGENRVILIGSRVGVLQKLQYGFCGGGGKCQENTIKFLEKFFQTIKFGKLWVLPWEPIMFYTINQ